MTNSKHTKKQGLEAIKENPAKKRMTPFEIIQKDIELYKVPLDPYQTYATILKMVENPNYRALRHNDTIMVLQNNGDHTGEGMIFTADTPKEFIKTMRFMYKALHTVGYKKVIFASTGMNIRPLLKRSGINYKIEPIKLRFGETVIDGDKVTVIE